MPKPLPACAETGLRMSSRSTGIAASEACKCARELPENGQVGAKYWTQGGEAPVISPCSWDLLQNARLPLLAASTLFKKHVIEATSWS